MRPAGEKTRLVAAMVAAFAVMPGAALATSAIVNLVDQRNAARAQVSALRHQPEPAPVTVSATPSPGSSASPQPVTASPSPTPSSLQMLADPARLSGGSGGGVPTRPGGGGGTNPRPPAPKPSPTPPPRTEACSPVRTAAAPAALGVRACTVIHTTARTGGAVHGTR